MLGEVSMYCGKGIELLIFLIEESKVMMFRKFPKISLEIDK